MDNVGDFLASVSLGYHCLALHLTALAMPAHSSCGDLLMSVRSFYNIFSIFDTSFFDINLNAWKLFHSERLTCFKITANCFFEVLGSDQGTSEVLQLADDVQYAIRNCFSRVFFFACCEAHPADTGGLSNRWCLGTGQGIIDTTAPVPLWASTALQSAVSL